MKKVQTIQHIICLSLLMVFFLACDKGGGITNPDPDPPTPPDISSSFEGDETSFLPGEIQKITITGATLGAEEYSAQLEDGTEVTLYHPEDIEDDILIVIIPEAAAGDHSLKFTLEEQQQSLDFVIEQYEPIEKPTDFVNQQANQIIAMLNTLINQSSETEVTNLLTEKRDELAAQIETFKTISSEEQAQIARIIYTYLNEANKAMKLKGSVMQATEACNVAITALEVHLKGVVTTTVFLAAGNILIATPIAPVGIFVSGLAVARMLLILEPLLDTVFIAVDVCLFPDQFELFAWSNAQMNTAYGAQANKASFEFSHDETREFLVKGTYDIGDELSSLLAQLRSILKDFYIALPDSWVTIIKKQDYTQVKNEDPELYSIGSISDDRISGTLAAQDSSILLTFKYKKGEMPDTLQSFSFTLANKNSAVLTTEATLKPGVAAYDMEHFYKIGEVTVDTLIAVNATSFEIEKTPEHGNLTMIDANLGIFKYEPSSDFNGSDSFTFTAANSSAESNTATVTISDNFRTAILGTWSLVTFEGGTPVGEYVVFERTEKCNFISIEYTLTFETLVISEDTWAYSGNERVKAHNPEYDPSTCNLLSEDIQIENYPYEETNPYTLDGHIYTTTIEEKQVTNKAIFITKDKLQLGDVVYIRQ